MPSKVFITEEELFTSLLVVQTIAVHSIALTEKVYGAFVKIHKIFAICYKSLFTPFAFIVYKTICFFSDAQKLLCETKCWQTRSRDHGQTIQKVTHINRPLCMILELQHSCSLLHQPLSLSSGFGWTHSFFLALFGVLQPHQDRTDTHCIQQSVRNQFPRKAKTKQISYINNTKKGSSGNPKHTGSSHVKRKAVSHFLQRGGDQFRQHFAVTHKSKYAIINSILRDQVDRSET